MLYLPPQQIEEVSEPEVKIEVIKTSVPANCNTYRPIVEKYDWDVETAMQIMNLESGCKPEAINWKDGHRGCSGSFGLAQVGCLHFIDGEDKLDPETNIKVAYRVYVGAGKSFVPWTTYSKVKL